jgi:hypothetical protein
VCHEPGRRDISDKINELSPKYGKTREFGIWSHAGYDGPVGSENTSKDPLSDNKHQMSLDGWGKINFNWATEGSTKAGFYGCNTGAKPKEGESFTTKISGLNNFKDVNVLGQTSSSYPSMYTNVRETNLAMRNGDFTNQTTYMVAAPPLGLIGNWTTTEANPIRISRNGKGETQNPSGQPYFQPGRKK